MFGLVLRRTLSAIPTLLLLSILSFTLLKLLPGDPVEVLLGNAQKDVSANELATMRRELGLDQSICNQYIGWLKGLAHGSFGYSYRDGRPVLAVIAEYLPQTISLIATSLLISCLLGTAWGFSMGYLELVHPSTKFWSNVLSASALGLYSIPNFWLGLILITLLADSHFFSFVLIGPHLPGENRFSFHLCNLILPAAVLASRRSAKLAMLIRSALLDEMTKAYVLAALARGVSYFALFWKHMGKNCLAPIINIIFLSLPALIGGSVVIETVFAWPGLGRLLVDATFARNYPILLALVLIYGTLVIMSNLCSDLWQLWLDPRLLEERTS